MVPAGTLVLAGPSFYREYSLPTSGEERAFGAGPTNAPSIIASTSSSAPESVEVLFLAADPTTPANTLGDVTVAAFDPSAAPVEITSLVPLRAIVRTGEAAWVETPRRYVTGKTLQVGLKRAKGAEIVGDPFPVNSLARHEMVLTTPSLGPQTTPPTEFWCG